MFFWEYGRPKIAIIIGKYNKDLKSVIGKYFISKKNEIEKIEPMIKPTANPILGQCLNLLKVYILTLGVPREIDLRCDFYYKSCWKWLPGTDSKRRPND